MFTTRYDSPKGPVISPAPSADGLLICCHGVYGDGAVNGNTYLANLIAEGHLDPSDRDRLCSVIDLFDVVEDHPRGAERIG